MTAVDPNTPREQPDLPALRARYRAERDKRLRPEGEAQYRGATGDLADLGRDPWHPVAARVPVVDASDDPVDVVVLGAGLGGLTAAARLREAGLARIRLVDVAGGVGGAWYWNRYPGVACDTEAFVYLPLLEEIGTLPSRRYAPGEEIRAHAERIAARYDLHRDALFGTRITGLAWDDDARVWIVGTDRDDRLAARYVVACGGVLNHLKLPGTPGIADFRGRVFHTSRWDYAHTGGTPDTATVPGALHGLADRRVAVVGTGATAIQVVPQLAREAGHLLVVQRTPAAVDTRDDAATDPEWWAALEPGWQRRRQDNFLAHVDGALGLGGGDTPDGAVPDLVGDRWTDTAPARGLARLLAGRDADDPARAFELADAEKMGELRARIDAVVDEPATAEALKPWYRQMCKRPTFSDTYLQTFNRPDVTLLDTGGRGVERFTPDGIVVGGVEHHVDTVVLATGFGLGVDPLARVGAPVHGRGGRSLAEHWADGLRTLHGWVSHGFPNLLHLGTSQNGASPNFAHILEVQATHIASVVAEAERDGALVEPTAAAEAAWVATIAERAVDQHAFLAECTPGYYNSEGRPRDRVEIFGGGAVEFHEILARWRERADRSDVLQVPR